MNNQFTNFHFQEMHELMIAMSLIRKPGHLI